MADAALLPDIEKELQKPSWRGFPPALENLYEARLGHSRRKTLANAMRVMAGIFIGAIWIDVHNGLHSKTIILIRLCCAALMLTGRQMLLLVSRQWVETLVISLGCCAVVAVSEGFGLIAQSQFSIRYVMAASFSVVITIVVLPLRPTSAVVALTACQIIYVAMLAFLPSALPLSGNADLPVFALGCFLVAFQAIFIRELRRRAMFLQNLRHEVTAVEMSKLNAELLRHSTTDMLTGLANRRHFEAEALQRCHQNGAPGLGLLLLDIDFFKKFNDSAGHSAGDMCLRKVAAAIEGALRHTDGLAARYGGEEFVVLLSAVTQEAAANIAERVRADVEALALPHPGLDGRHVTVSVGVSWRTDNASGHDLELLLHHADIALYSAKRAGRNRVVIAGARPDDISPLPATKSEIFASQAPI